MITFALIGLFIIQLISIFVIILLYSKLAKFKDLELRQDRLLREMDDAIGTYLFEMRDENDRFLQELKIAPTKPIVAQQSNPSTESAVAPASEVNPQTVESLLTETRKVMPKAVAANVYIKHKAQQQVEPDLEPFVEEKQHSNLPSFEQEVLVYHEQGLSVEEIAKKTQRGKTEIELLIKFHA